MRVTLDQLNVAELRSLCRRHDLAESHDKADMLTRLRAFFS